MMARLYMYTRGERSSQWMTDGETRIVTVAVRFTDKQGQDMVVDWSPTHIHRLYRQVHTQISKHTCFPACQLKGPKDHSRNEQTKSLDLDF